MKPEIKNLEKVASRILNAIKNKEKIILYGDSDLDGIASVIILKETIKNLGGEVSSVYFPDRENEGYGINIKALDFLRKEAPALLITVDCGIGNIEEVKMANEMGFEVIIIDHHEVLNSLPEARIIVDPKQKSDNFPFKDFSAAGIVFRLSQALVKDYKFSENLRKSFLELAALATISDMMPQVEENKELIEEGLDSLESTWRPGLKAFFELDFNQDPDSFKKIVPKIIPALNSGESKDHLNESYLLLTTNSLEEAKEIASELSQKAYLKQVKVKGIVYELEKRILEKLGESVIFEGHNDLSVALTGPVASKICASQRRPTFIFAEKGEESQGAVRMPKNLNGVKALIKCGHLLKTFGGHPLASGFRIENKNLEEFKNCLVNYFSKL